jgi:hypothetical protein
VCGNGLEQNVHIECGHGGWSVDVLNYFGKSGASRRGGESAGWVVYGPERHCQIYGVFVRPERELEL